MDFWNFLGGMEAGDSHHAGQHETERLEMQNKKRRQKLVTNALFNHWFIPTTHKKVEKTSGKYFSIFWGYQKLKRQKQTQTSHSLKNVDEE